MCLPQAAMVLGHAACTLPHTRGALGLAEPQPTLTPAARRDFGRTKSAYHMLQFSVLLISALLGAVTSTPPLGTGNISLRIGKMPATTDSHSATDRAATTTSFVDDYLADWDDDPFRSPSPEPGAKKKDDNSKKRKDPDTLGIDEQIDVKKPRAPRVKLDEARLLSENGIPKLRKMAPKVRLKGKGHEVQCLPLVSCRQKIDVCSSRTQRDCFPFTRNGSTTSSPRQPSSTHSPWWKRRDTRRSSRRSA